MARLHLPARAWPPCPFLRALPATTARSPARPAAKPVPSAGARPRTRVPRRAGCVPGDDGTMATALARGLRDLQRSGRLVDQGTRGPAVRLADAGLGAQASAYLHGFVRVAPEVIDVLVPSDGEWRLSKASSSGGAWRRRRRSGPPRPGSGGTRLSSNWPSPPATPTCCGWRPVRRVPRGLPISTPCARRSPGALRVRRRRLLCDLLAVVEAGVESPLEYRYDRDVERPHGLPGRSRVPSGRRRTVDSCRPGLHRSRNARRAGRSPRASRRCHRRRRVARQRRADRAARLTLRYRWRHIAGHPCDTAVQVAAALGSQGWAGRPRPCGPGCPVAA